MLVFHSFDDLIDDSGNGHNAVLGGDAYLADGCVHFDGEEDYVDIGPETFGAVNPCGGTHDYTIAIAYACTNTAQWWENVNSMLVCIGPLEGIGFSDFLLFTNNYGQYVEIFYEGAIGYDDQSTVPFSNGDVHWAFVTYQASPDTLTLYAIDDEGSAASYSTGIIDYEADYSTYIPRLGMAHPGVQEELCEGGECVYRDLEGEICAFGIWDRILTTDEMEDISPIIPCVSIGCWWPPQPVNGAIRVDPNELLLTWYPDPCSTSETVYFSDNFADVNERSEDANMGVQDANYYPSDGNYLDVNLGTTYYWAIDETLNIVHPCEASGAVWSFTVKTKQADLPDPENGAEYASPCPTLEWDPGAWAVTHKVYWSDVFAEVNDRTTDPCVLNEPTAESLSIGPLSYDTEFFWAVDEVNDGDVCTPGPLWSFQTGSDPPVDTPNWHSSEDSLYAMWGFDDDWGTGKPVADPCWVIPSDPNFDANCVDPPNDWLANYMGRSGIADCNGPGGGLGENSIRLKHTDYAKPGQIVTIRAELVWSGENSPTVVFERLTNWGDGPEPQHDPEIWAETGNIKNSSEPAPIYEFQLCDGWMYSVFETEFEAVQLADNIHILIETYGDFYLDYVEVDARWRQPLEAHDPTPPDGDVNTPGKLTWRPGLYADKHDVYFGTDEAAVADACSSVLVSNNQDPNYYPPGAGSVSLNPSTTYYWRVDEVNDACDPCLWPGQVWSFTTIQYILIDDFETYASTSELYAVWEDWHTLPEQGGESLLEAAASLVHGGLQAMKFRYDHGYGKPLIKHTYNTPQDWTAGGLAALWMWFYGDANDGAGNLADDMYVTLEDSDGDKATIDYTDPRSISIPLVWRWLDVDISASLVGDANDLWRKSWFEWGLSLEDFNEANNVNPDKIKSIAFGITGGNSGQIYYDDIRLYVPRCIPEYSRQFGDIAGPWDGIIVPVNVFLGLETDCLINYYVFPGLETDCLINYYDVELMAGDWLRGDMWIWPVPPPDANLIAHYVFDDVNGLNDVSGPPYYHGVAINDVNVHDGILTLVNDDSPEVNAVQISGLAADNPFRGKAKGGGDFTIAMWFRTEEPSILFSSCPYDPCVTEPPNDLDPSNHAMALFIIQFGEDDPVINYDNWYINASDASGTPMDGEWHHVVTTYDADTNDHVTYLDAAPGDAVSFDPNLIDPCSHSIRIGSTLQMIEGEPGFPYIEGCVDMTGDIDDVRVYNRVLSHGEIAYLFGIESFPLCRPVPSPAELWIGEPPGQRYVNFRDFAILANNWLREVFWPPR
jgi:hypothetical protein